MLAEIAQFSLIIALCIACVLSILPIIGAHKNIQGWMSFSRPATYIIWCLIAFAYGILTYAFIIHDYSIEYVAHTSNNAQPLLYRISGVWGAHEGSLLLWVLILASWSALVAKFSRGIPRDMIARVLAVLGMVMVGFLSFMLFTSNPFDRLLPAPIDGRELNPLLQDFGLAIHPPMLYMGYVGFSVVFAFAIAAMLSGKLDTAWARWSRPWTTVAWLFLTIGITLGSWWAYYELGWGGWWFWDPVENASFMPWLVGTALIHSLAVTEKRGVFKAWTVLLAVVTFSLSLLGTFLVRSGVLTSVHSFATDPARGLFILVFLCLVIGGSLLLYAIRAPQIRSYVGFSLFSKEANLLINNVLLVVAAAMILFGTLSPIIFVALGLGTISVGAPYFNPFFLLLTIPLAVVMGIGAMSRWKKDQLSRFYLLIGLFSLLSIIPSLLINQHMAGEQSISWAAVAGIALALWVVYWTIYGLIDRVKHQNKSINSLLMALGKIPASIWGMTVAHLGVAVFIVGITNTNIYSIEKDIRISKNDSYQLAGYDFKFNGTKKIQVQNYIANQGSFIVSRNNKIITELKPEKRYYNSSKPMTEAAIDGNLVRDLYISLGEPLENGDWTVRLYYKSFVRCIWLGGLLMALGALIATADRRYRRPIKKQP